MFTTGQHIYLYLTAGCYAAAFLCCFKSKRVGVSFLSTGLILHLLYLLGRGWLGGVFIPNALVEGPFFFPFCVSGLALYAAGRQDDRSWNWLILTAFLFTLLAIMYAKGIIPPTPNKVIGWAILFFVFECMAHALFISGAVCAAVVLITKKEDAFFHQYIVWGFVAYSISQVIGALWCYIGWGNTFNWSDRHLGSAAIWTLYAAYIHLKFLPEWYSRKKAGFAVAAAAFVLLISISGYIKEMYFPRVGG